MEGLDACLLHDVVGAIGVECLDVHAEAFGDAGDVAAYLTECLEPEVLALEFEAGGAGIHVAGCHDAHAEDELGDGVGVLSGSVLGDDAMGGGCGEVDVIVSGTGAYDDLEVAGCVEHLGVDLVGADDERVGIGDGGEKVGAGGVFLKEGELVAGVFDDLADAVDCHSGKWLLGGYKNFFHNLTAINVCIQSLSLPR